MSAGVINENKHSNKKKKHSFKEYDWIVSLGQENFPLKQIINVCLNIKIKARYWKAVIGTPEPRLMTEVAENGTKNIADLIKRSEFLKKQKIP